MTMAANSSMMCMLVFSVTKEITEALTSTASRSPFSKDIAATKLCSHNQEASIINTSQLDKLEGIIH